MYFKNSLYALTLSGIFTLSGCKGTLPGLQNPEIRAELEGTYKGKIDGMEVTYVVEKDKCRASYTLIEPFVVFGNSAGVEIRDIIIKDLGCDNLFDSAPDKYGFVRDRKYFQEYYQKHDPTKNVETIDWFLELAQGLVKPENKVKK